MDEFRDDPFKGKDPFANAGMDVAPAADPFQNEDPFKGSMLPSPFFFFPIFFLN